MSAPVRDSCHVVEGADAVAGDAASDGIAHLQAAARELIKAARAVLDVAEELVDDPATVGSVAEAVGAVVHSAAQAGRRAVGQVMGDGPDDERTEGEGGRSRRDGSGPGVERITIG